MAPTLPTVVVMLLIWLVVPARADSAWKRFGVFGHKQPKTASATPPPGERPGDVS